MHICRALALYAKLDKVAMVDMESARPSVKPILWMVPMRVALMRAFRRSMAKTSETWPIETKDTVMYRTFGTEARRNA